MRQINKHTRLAALMAILVTMIVAGCKTIPTYQRPAAVKLPTSFSGQQDTSSMADLPWKQLFIDTALQQLIDTALRNNFDYQTTLQRIAIANANYRQTRAPLLPSANGVVTTGIEQFSGNTNQDIKNLPAGNPASYVFLGVQSSWEIDLWNKLKNRRKAALQRYLASGYGLRLVKTMLVSEVAKKYYDLIRLDAQLAIVHKNTLLQQKAADVIVVQKQAGRATELAVRQFQAQLINTRALEVGYRQQRIETENELNNLLGRFPQPVPRSDTLMLANDFKGVKAGLPASLLLRRPDVQQAELNMMANEADVLAARALFFPTVTISPFFGYNSFGYASTFDAASIVFGLAGGLTAPLFNRIAIKANFASAGATASAAFYNYQKTVVNSYTEVATNLSRLNNFNQLYNLKVEQTKALQEAVSTANDLYLAGFASYLEVILAQGNVLSAELEMINANNNVYLSFIDLYRSLGGGWQS